MEKERQERNTCKYNRWGEGMTGHKTIWTEEMKNKIRVANSKRVITEVTRDKLRLALKARGIINKN